jgi:hypothetical protein
MVTVQDPDFLLPPVPDASYLYGYGHGDTDWTYSASNLFIAATDSFLSPGVPPQGQLQCCFLQSDGSNVGTVSQTIDFGAGGLVTFAAYLAQRPIAGESGTMVLMIDGTEVLRQTPGDSWALYTFSPFTISPGSHLVTIGALLQSGDNSIVVTGVSLFLDPVNTVARPKRFCWRHR